jgi:hypothetical protein
LRRPNLRDTSRSNTRNTKCFDEPLVRNMWENRRITLTPGIGVTITRLPSHISRAGAHRRSEIHRRSKIFLSSGIFDSLCSQTRYHSHIEDLRSSYAPSGRQQKSKIHGRSEISLSPEIFDPLDSLSLVPLRSRFGRDGTIDGPEESAAIPILILRGTNTRRSSIFKAGPMPKRSVLRVYH